MTYDIRLFSQSTHAVSVLQLQSALDSCRFEVLDGDDAVWTQLLVTSLYGDEICIVERASRRLMTKEIDALRSDLDDYRPRSAALWADAYIASTRVLYGCRYLSFGLSHVYAGTPSSVMWAIQSIAGSGIIHAEGQGFSNEDGYQITWEFSDRVKGPRQMAVLGDGGRWQPFEMDLGDPEQRAAFRAGARPLGVELLEFN
jgi:hypothetical protein